MNEVPRLQKAIKDLHGLDSEYVESVPVRETFQGKTVWEGEVKVFRVRGHPQAEYAYAWSYQDDDDQVHHVAVIGLPPVDSALSAVRVMLVAEARKRGLHGAH